MTSSRRVFDIKTVMIGVCGLLLVVLAISSLVVTLQSNRQQQLLISCGINTIDRSLQAVRVRDNADIELNSATLGISEARQRMYHVLADAVHDKPSSMADLQAALVDYDAKSDKYRQFVLSNSVARKAAPLPSPYCADQFGK